MSIELLSAAVLNVVGPYLIEAGKGAAGKIGEASVEIAGKLIAHLREKLTGRAKDSLDMLEVEPDNPKRIAAFQTDLEDVLKAQPALEQQLREILPPSVLDATVMNQTVSGAGAKAVQIKGSGNRTTII